MTTLATADLTQARKYFERTRYRIGETVRNLSEPQWRFKPDPETWSIAENLEHMVTVHENVLAMLQKNLAQAPAPPPGYDTQTIDGIILEKIPDRSKKTKMPEHLPQPTGQWSIGSALERLATNFERLSEFVESTPHVRDHVLDSPPLRFVTNGAHQIMDGFQWALAVAAHDERHLNQILELQADPRYISHASLSAAVSA